MLLTLAQQHLLNVFCSLPISICMYNYIMLPFKNQNGFLVSFSSARHDYMQMEVFLFSLLPLAISYYMTRRLRFFLLIITFTSCFRFFFFFKFHSLNSKNEEPVNKFKLSIKLFSLILPPSFLLLLILPPSFLLLHPFLFPPPSSLFPPPSSLFPHPSSLFPHPSFLLLLLPPSFLHISPSSLFPPHLSYLPLSSTSLLPPSYLPLSSTSLLPALLSLPCLFLSLASFSFSFLYLLLLSLTTSPIYKLYSSFQRNHLY